MRQLVCDILNSLSIRDSENFRGPSMNEQNQAVDFLEICDLEYDVAGVGATEEASSEANHAAHFILFYRLPETR